MAEAIVSGIYKIENLVNGKIYVGSAVDVRRRLQNHKSALRNNRHCNVKLQRAWAKYGESLFDFAVVEIIETKEQLVSREQRWIDKLNSVSGGYNIAPFAYSSLGRKSTEETRLKQSIASKGRKLSREHVQKLLGRPVLDETRAKISSANTGKLLGKPWSEARRAAHKSPWAGKKHTEETIEKMRKAQTGKTISEAQRKLISENNKLRPPCSEETRKRLSEAGKGRVVSEETKAKISASHTGKKQGPPTDGHRAKIALALTGKKKPPRSPEHIRKIVETQARNRLLKEQQAA